MPRTKPMLGTPTIHPIPVKWALYEMGMIPAGIRLPLTPLAEQYREPIRQALGQAGILKH